MKTIISLIFFALISISSISSASAYTSTGAVRQFSDAIGAIVTINTKIQKSQGQILLRDLFDERAELVKKATLLYRGLREREIITPSLDVSRRYHLALQRYPLSCEIAALRMILQSLLKKPVSEESIMRSLPHYPYGYSGGVWGDPEREFVGSYYGSQRGRSGYGVYEIPLLSYTKALGISGRIMNTKTHPRITSDERISTVLSEIRQGNHVILWGDWCTHPDRDDGIISKIDQYSITLFQIPAKNRCERFFEDRTYTWMTPEGKQIRGLSGEHAFLLLGYAGDDADPTHIIVWDTDTGKHTYPIEEWKRKWRMMEYRSLIIAGSTDITVK